MFVFVLSLEFMLSLNNDHGCVWPKCIKPFAWSFQHATSHTMRRELNKTNSIFPRHIDWNARVLFIGNGLYPFKMVAIKKGFISIFIRCVYIYMRFFPSLFIVFSLFISYILLKGEMIHFFSVLGQWVLSLFSHCIANRCRKSPVEKTREWKK